MFRRSGKEIRSRLFAGESLERRDLLTTLADLDADGDLDGYAGNAWFENVDGQGNFLGREFTDRPFTISTVADLDNDGDLDFISSEPRWYENRPGPGRFEVDHAFPDGAIPGSRIRSLDFEGDGDVDVLVFSGHVVSLYENIDSQGKLVLKSRASVDGTKGADDVDGDGDLDLAVVRQNRLFLFQNNGDGSYTEQLLVEPDEHDIQEAFSLFDAYFLDVDGDETAELVYETFVFTDSPHTSIIRLKNEGGRFDGRPLYVGATSYGENRLVDVDHDGDIDYLAADHMSVSLSWRINEGDGNFSRGGRFGEFETSIKWNLGDLNGDGTLDVVYDRYANGAPVWHNLATDAVHTNTLPDFGPLQAGDANQDYFFDESDLIQVAQAGTFESGNADWETGDWGGAPGGSWGQPPAGNGRFNSADLDQAFATGLYRTGGYDPSATAPIDRSRTTDVSVAGGDLTLTYTAATGSLQVTNHGAALTAFRLLSKSGALLQDAAVGFDTNRFDARSAQSLFQFNLEAFWPNDAGAIDVGNVLTPQLTWDAVQRDLRVDGARRGGGDLGNVRFTCTDCALDIDTFQEAIRDERWVADWDFTKDGVLDNSDLSFLVETLLETSIGDANLDGRFDSSDFVVVFTTGEYEDRVTGNSTWADGDFNGDGDFDSRDLVFALQRGGFADTVNAKSRENRRPIDLPVWDLLALCCDDLNDERASEERFDDDRGYNRAKHG